MTHRKEIPRKRYPSAKTDKQTQNYFAARRSTKAPLVGYAPLQRALLPLVVDRGGRLAAAPQRKLLLRCALPAGWVLSRILVRVFSKLPMESCKSVER